MTDIMESAAKENAAKVQNFWFIFTFSCEFNREIATIPITSLRVRKDFY